MKIGITTLNNRVSPVLDSSRKLLIVAMENGEEIDRHEHTIGDVSLLQKIDRLKKLNVEVIICGALSKQLNLLHLLKR